MTTPSSGPMTGGQALVVALAAHGVDTAFGIPGTHNLEIYRYLPTYGIRHVVTRHEQGAGYAADGYARTTGRVGVAITTTGPALINALTALTQAWTDSVPVLAISPGMPLAHPATGNGLLHESRDQGAAVRALIGTSLRCTDIADIPRAVAQAFAIMTSGRPRPAHLEVPLDLLTGIAETAVVPPLPRVAPSPSPDSVAAAAAALGAASSPVMLVGGGARGAAAEIQALAERLGAPVVTTTNGKGTLPEDHPLALGAGIQLPAVRALVEESDAVLAVGTELAPADLWWGPLPVAGKLVRIDIDPVGVVTNATPGVPVVGDAATALAAVLAELPAASGTGDGDGGRHISVADWRERKRADGREAGAGYIDWIDAIELPRDVIIGADNAMACYYGAMPNLPAYTPGSYLFPSGFGTLGYGLPAAIGAKIGNPGRNVIAMLGDGGIMFTLPELAAAVAEGLALPVLVFDNGGYGEIRDEMVARGDVPHAVTFEAPDFAALGRALGGYGVRVDAPGALPSALGAALAADKPTVIHIVMRGSVS